MKKLILSLALSVLVAGCGSDDNDSGPIVEEPDSVTLSQADSIDLTVDSFNPETLAIHFSLIDSDGRKITEAGDDFRVIYLGFPGPYESSFKVPWHEGLPIACNSDTEICGGVMTELEPGKYLFTPNEAPEFAERLPILKYGLEIHGRLASSTMELKTYDKS